MKTNYIITCRQKGDYDNKRLSLEEAIKKIESSGDYNENKINGMMDSGKDFQILTDTEIIRFVPYTDNGR